MAKGRHAAAIPCSNDEPDDEGLPESENLERTLILTAAPRSRRVQLMAQGVKHIRCICCNQIRSLVSAIESEEGWICKDCAPVIIQKLNRVGKKGRNN